MAHPEQQAFCARVKARFPKFFEGRRVLDCGSLDVNGTNRDLFAGGSYTGIDVGAGKGVDIVTPIHEFNERDGAFDVIVSTECFEHDAHYERSLQNIVRLLKPGGLFFFTCATTGRPEHGTRRCSPELSPLTQLRWADYYKNLTEADIRAALHVDAVFSSYEFSFQQSTCDLYFWGLKREECRVGLGVPVLSNYEGLGRLLSSAASGSVKPAAYYIVDNGGALDMGRVSELVGGARLQVVRPGENWGVAKSWNWILDSARGEPVVISNDDIVLGRETFRELAEGLQKHPFVEGEGWALFGQTAECDVVGRYDENFWPAYWEDVDMDVRLRREGIVPVKVVTTPVEHGGWATTRQLGDPEWLRHGRERSQWYFLAKWGAPSQNPRWNGHPGFKQYAEPFRGDPPAGWSNRVAKRGEPLVPLLHEFVNQVAKEIGAKTYLQIGTNEGYCFSRVEVPTKFGVDPNPVPTAVKAAKLFYACSADKFLAQPDLGGHDIDLVLLGAEHHWEHVLSAISGIEPLLSEKAVVLIHNCNPMTEAMQAREYAGGAWTGDVWKAIGSMREDGSAVRVLESDYGIGVYVPWLAEPQRRASAFCGGRGVAEWTYADLEAARSEILGLVSPWRFWEWFRKTMTNRAALQDGAFL